MIKRDRFMLDGCVVGFSEIFSREEQLSRPVKSIGYTVSAMAKPKPVLP